MWCQCPRSTALPDKGHDMSLEIRHLPEGFLQTQQANAKVCTFGTCSDDHGFIVLYACKYIHLYINSHIGYMWHLMLHTQHTMCSQKHT